MQLTSPVFLFFFMPLSFLALPFVPPRHRKAALCALSVLWLLIANRTQPLALVQLLLLPLLATVLAALPDRAPRVRAAVGIVLPIAALLAARLLAEYAPFPYVYPTGLTVMTLGAVSIAIDRYRGDAPDREGPLSVLAYLLFFPTMLAGPILRYKQFLYVTEHISPDRERFSKGAQLYMLGFIKRVAAAAVLMRAIKDVLAISQHSLPPLALLLLLVMAYALLYSFVSGTTDMARGLMSIYGMHPPRGQNGAVPLLLPHRVLYGLLLSLDRYLEDYVAEPLRRHLPTRVARPLSVLLIFALTVLFYRTRVEILLLALPLLFCALLSMRLGHFRRAPRHPLVRVLASVFNTLCLSILSLGLLMEDPLDVLSLIRTSFSIQDHYSFFYLFGAVSDARYLTFCLLFVAIIPISHYYPILLRHLKPRVAFAIRIAVSLLLGLFFCIALLYFLPQFPQYADPVYGSALP